MITESCHLFICLSFFGFVLLKTYLTFSVLILMIIVYDIRTIKVLTFGKTNVQYKFLPWVKRRYKTSTYPCIVDSIRQKPRKQIKIWQLVWDWYRQLVDNWYLFDNLCYRNTGCTEKLSYDSYNTKPRNMTPSAFHRSDLVLKVLFLLGMTFIDDSLKPCLQPKMYDTAKAFVVHRSALMTNFNLNCFQARNVFYNLF